MAEGSDQRERRLAAFVARRAALIDYATPFAGDRMAAEDVVQEAWLRFDSGAAATAPIGNPVAYLRRIVRNILFDRHRGRAGQPPVESIETAPVGAIVDAAPSPEAAAIHRDQLACVVVAVAELPERTRIAFEMNRLGGHTLQEVARHLSISVGLAHQLVRDAVTHCAERLGDRDDR